MTDRAPRGGLRAARTATAAAAALLALACTDLQLNTPGPVVSLQVTPDTVVLRVGDTLRLKAAPLDATAALRAQAQVRWASGSAAVAGVDSTGLVTGIGAGTTRIDATVDGIQDSVLAIVTGAPTTMAVYAGAGQSAAVNSAVAVPPAVKVTDAGGNPVSRVPVIFAATGGGGTAVGGGPILTGLDGVAAVGSWILGGAAGANTLSATTAESTVTTGPVMFTATATVGPPSAGNSSIAASPTAIAPSTGQSLTTITVTVRDSAGSTVAGATVTLSATGTGNIIFQPASPTDLAGKATGTFASSVAGTKTVSATVNGTVAVLQTVDVLVTANAPAALAVQTQPAGATSNVVFTTQPVVEFRDAFGNLVPTATGPVTVSLVSGDGVLTTTGSFTVNAVNGRATFAGLRITGLRAGGDTLGTGPHLLQFTSPGFNAVTTDTLRVASSFAYNVHDIWVRGGCASGCHTFGTYAGNFGNATLAPCAGQARIVAGDTVNSLIYQKIRSATPACGVYMPPPTTPLLSARQVRIVRDWILAGAPNN